MGTTDFAYSYIAKGDGKVYQGRTWYARRLLGKNHACIYKDFGPTLCGEKVSVLAGDPEWTPEVDDACLSCTRIYNKIKNNDKERLGQAVPGRRRGMTETECGFCDRGRLNGETCPYCRGSGRS